MSVVMAGVLLLLMLLTGAVVTYAGASAANATARTAADQAALAGASVLLRPVDATMSPCDAAADLAARNGGALATCRVMSASVQVSVTVKAPWSRTASAHARAGAPEHPARDSGEG